jgi:hypothetical protein
MSLLAVATTSGPRRIACCNSSGSNPRNCRPAVFPNAASASALIDRLTHHSHVVVIKGDSYRKEEAKQDRKGRPDEQDEA